MANSAEATDISARDGRRAGGVRRWAPIAEVASFVGSVLVFIWVVQPRASDGVQLTYYLLAALYAWSSARAHGDTWRSAGMRLDNLAEAARIVLPATLLLGLVLIAAPYAWMALTGHPHRPATVSRGARVLAELPLSFGWALVQQYVLQVLVQRRLWEGGLDRHAPLVAALLFSVAHAPNAPLMAMTFVAGWLWTSCYRRRPNLPALALSHALLAGIVLLTLPVNVTGHLRVGPGYWR